MKSASTSQPPSTELRVELRQPDPGLLQAVAPSVVTLTWAVIGWLIIERFARRRERRQEIRDLIKQVRETVDDILEDSIEFFSLDGGDPQAQRLSVSIKAKLALIAKLISVIAQAGLNVKASPNIIRFRRAVTAEPFDSAARLASEANAHRLALIAAEGHDLVATIEARFFEAFHVKMRSRSP